MSPAMKREWDQEVVIMDDLSYRDTPFPCMPAAQEASFWHPPWLNYNRMWIAWEWGPRKVINGNGHHNHPPTTICRSALWESDPIHVQVTPTNGLLLRSPLIHWPASGTSRNPINPVDEKINYPCPFVHGLVHLVGGWLYGHREEIALAKYFCRKEREEGKQKFN